MKCTVRFTDGQSEREYDSIQAAARALLGEYPDGVIYDAGGFDRDPDDADITYDVRDGRAGLVWATEAESRNDDGANAVAAIEVEQ